MIRDWVSQAIDFANTDQAKLGRVLEDLLGRSFDRAAVNKMISGGRHVRADEMLAISKATGYPLPNDYSSVVPVIGLVAATPDGTIDFCESPGILGRVTMPPWGSINTVALEVRGSSMRGFAENGWFVYYDKRNDGIDDSLLGQLCVIGLVDGRTLVKTPHRGSAPGLYHLESSSAPLLKDQQIRWSSQVTAFVPPNIARMVPEVDEPAEA